MRLLQVANFLAVGDAHDGTLASYEVVMSCMAGWLRDHGWQKPSLPCDDATFE